ncbi:MAG TPA: hypothetical protein VNK44_01105 [Candidatus Nitrosotenuis sp.]|nr:hypothetical protein [Candidatus Nitrosotenuis sp.]
MKTRLLLAAFAIFSLISFNAAFGHGVGYETLPPQMLGDRKVAMEVNSSVDNATGRKQITFSMFDTNTGITVRDVKYHIQTIKASTTLFEGTFEAANGILVFDLIPDSSKQVTVAKKSDDSFFGFLIGGSKGTIEARGDVFRHGGLYKFKIDVLEAERYSRSKNTPVIFESGLSFPEVRTLEINDPEYGRQKIQAITYYETLDSLNYDAKTKSIRFTMPFEWTASNINQTTAIHQEIVIPKTFGALQVSKYGVTINNIPLPEQSITVDDFGTENRVIHLLVYQNEIFKLYEMQHKTLDKIDFEVFPKTDDLLVVAATDNVQYKIALTTKPQHVFAGSDVLLMFKIYDIFLADKAVSTSFDLVIESGERQLFKTSGKSSDADKWDEIAFAVPKDANKLVLRFENLGGNKLARAEIPIPLVKNHEVIPPWIKNNARWWCDDSILDVDFLNGIEYMISQGVIKVRDASISGSEKAVPAWVKNSACWWADGSVTDDEFINSIAFLVKNGIIKP